MKWIVHLTVVLLNILWVAFFLTDPLAVFVQRRSSNSSDEEMKVGEFCLQPPSDKMWTSTPGPADVPTDKTRMTSDVYAAPKTAAGEPPSTSSTIRDLNEATTAPPTVQTSTSSEVTSVISSSTSEAAPVPQTEIWDEQYHDSCCPVVTTAKVPLKVNPFQGSVPRREERHQWSSGSSNLVPDTCCFSYYPRRIKKDLIVRYYMTDNCCTKPAVILVTQKSRNICADPSLSWVKGIMKNIDHTTY
ncbi:uncharacterized protein LOC111582714 [Amphiprion ocellaris]|uniref:C-C motif chemokine n=1 Tax=Amphiprion ocellaris TaxID=80972 RepID=A0AAQ5ZZQ1_AMPOC|nr:uncharacterized protein LOC111582714 [Amphiprion ocellaris]